VVLDGFVDDSGSSGGKFGGDVYVLAGFLSTADKWEQFSDDWEQICDQEPKTPDFKMRKAHRSDYGLTDSQRDTRVRELVALVKKKAMYRVDVILNKRAYEDIVKGRIPSQIDNPYFLLFYSVILNFAEFMDKAGIEGTVDWVFDDQGTVGTDAAQWYDWIKATAKPELRKRLGSKPIFRHDNDVLPIKSADLYAWQVRRHLDVEQPMNVAHNDDLDSLLGIYGVSGQIKPEDMEEFVNNLHAGMTLKSKVLFLLPKPKTPDSMAI
jgi:Protein of unknown function (DUF3800)